MQRTKALLRNLLRRREANRDLDAELDAFADEMNARCQHGVRVEQVREQVRSARLGAGLESCARDLRYAARMLRKALPLTLACVATFALGIGANTAVFSLANAILLRPLPVDHPAQLAAVLVTRSGQPGGSLSTDEITRLREQSRSIFQSLATANLGPMGLSVDRDARPIWGSYVSGNFFSLLGIHPALGRFFYAPGNVVDRDPVLVLSHAYWVSRFGANPDVIGRSAVVNGAPVTIIGVAPAGFQGLSPLIDTEAYVPTGLAAAGSHQMALARLRAGVELRAAEARLAVVAANLDPGHHLRLGLISSAAGSFGGTSSLSPLYLAAGLFLTLSCLVLLLAAANIMGLLLARARTRQREMAVRSALGAPRFRLARQVLFETLLLAAFGCVAGCVVGAAAMNLLQRSAPQTAGVPLTLGRLAFDWRVLLFALAAGLLMALVAGLVPAWRAAGADPNMALHGDTGSGRGDPRQSKLRRQGVRGTLVAGQIALSLTLLVAGGLFARSLGRARSAALGFQPHGLWNLTLDTTGAGDTPAQGAAFFAALLPRVRALPGVASVSLAQTEPFGVETDGSAVTVGAAAPIGAGWNYISSGYFSTLRVPLLQGRGLADSDDASAPRVAVVNQAMAARLWPGLDPIGRAFTSRDDPAHPLRVVGVVGNMLADFTDPVGPFFFRPLAQHFTPAQILQVRAASAVAALALIRQLGPNIPVQVESMDTTVNGVNGLYIFNVGAALALALALGLLGLFLAAVGVYGVVAYAAAQRTREIGIRIALGARPAQVAAGVVRHSLALLAVGAAVGLLLAAALAKLVGSFLVGVSAFDPLTYAAAVLVLGAVALAAALRPAWRATRADPLAALRVE